MSIEINEEQYILSMQELHKMLAPQRQTPAQRKAAEMAMFEKWYNSLEVPLACNAAWAGWWARANDGEVPDEA